MDLLSWDSRLELGVELLDAQHYQLFELFNRLERVMNEDQGPDSVQPVVEALFSFAESHFAAEERLMIQTGYPRLGPHREAHRQILQQGRALVTRYGQGQDRFGGDLLRFVRTALFDHIRVWDREVADQVARVSPSTQASEPPA